MQCAHDPHTWAQASKQGRCRHPLGQPCTSNKASGREEARSARQCKQVAKCQRLARAQPAHNSSHRLTALGAKQLPRHCISHRALSPATSVGCNKCRVQGRRALHAGDDASDTMQSSQAPEPCAAAGGSATQSKQSTQKHLMCAKGSTQTRTEANTRHTHSRTHPVQSGGATAGQSLLHQKPSLGGECAIHTAAMQKKGVPSGWQQTTRAPCADACVPSPHGDCCVHAKLMHTASREDACWQAQARHHALASAPAC
jgi:hypothetical protein